MKEATRQSTLMSILPIGCKVLRLANANKVVKLQAGQKAESGEIYDLIGMIIDMRLDVFPALTDDKQVTVPSGIALSATFPTSPSRYIARIERSKLEQAVDACRAEFMNESLATGRGRAYRSYVSIACEKIPFLQEGLTMHDQTPELSESRESAEACSIKARPTCPLKLCTLISI